MEVKMSKGFLSRALQSSQAGVRKAIGEAMDRLAFDENEKVFRPECEHGDLECDSLGPERMAQIDRSWERERARIMIETAQKLGLPELHLEETEEESMGQSGGIAEDGLLVSKDIVATQGTVRTCWTCDTIWDAEAALVCAMIEEHRMCPECCLGLVVPNVAATQARSRMVQALPSECAHFDVRVDPNECYQCQVDAYKRAGLMAVAEARRIVGVIPNVKESIRGVAGKPFPIVGRTVAMGPEKTARVAALKGETTRDDEWKATVDATERGARGDDSKRWPPELTVSAMEAHAEELRRKSAVRADIYTRTREPWEGREVEVRIARASGGFAIQLNRLFMALATAPDDAVVVGAVPSTIGTSDLDDIRLIVASSKFPLTPTVCTTGERKRPRVDLQFQMNNAGTITRVDANWPGL